jgi:hypothetical protein
MDVRELIPYLLNCLEQNTLRQVFLVLPPKTSIAYLYKLLSHYNCELIMVFPISIIWLFPRTVHLDYSRPRM